ncbi:hypothetical protein GCM10009827_044190 [Dactylosporangium maewongense]|uniref:HPP family protein n=1 Tax=Dactylosporangium maewongense TaxID=634393 RepID=A0ABN2AQ62_9ACTN
MLVRAVDEGTGPATAATHRCVWAALAATVAWPALNVGGVTHPQAAAVGVGLLTVLPLPGPALGIAFAAGLVLMTGQPFAPLFALAAASLIALVGVPAQHLPGWMGPLSLPTLGATALFAGLVAGLPGVLAGLLLASATSALIRRA